MSAIRRAAVTGLLAAWLSPLPAPPQGYDCDGRCAEPRVTEAPIPDDKTLGRLATRYTDAPPSSWTRSPSPPSLPSGSGHEA